MLFAGTGCSAVLDFSNPVLDGAPPPPDAAPDAGEDLYESMGGDTSAMAVPITPGSYDLSIYGPGDEDWFTFSVADVTTIGVALDHPFGVGPIDVNLYTDPTMMPVASIFSIGNTGSLTYVGSAGTYYIQVLATSAGDINSYSLTLTLAGPADAGPPVDAGAADAGDAGADAGL